MKERIDVTNHRHQYPSELAEKFIIRFERPGHRDELKRQASEAKRTLNKHLLYLIERGQAVESEGAQA